MSVTATAADSVASSTAQCIPAATAAALTPEAVASALGTDLQQGLSSREAARRLAQLGPNALRSHRASALAVLGRQFKSALLVLLLVTATASFVLGERSDAVIIGVILGASVGLGFVNEYRAARATEALHDNVHHTVVTVRDAKPSAIDVTDLVPGDLVHLSLGGIVPADVRLIEATSLECDESILTGESEPSEKSAIAVATGSALADLSSVAFMGTVVHGGSGAAIVVSTAGATEFGRIAAGLSHSQPETDFQVGLRRFSLLLMQVALTLTTLIFITNVLLHRSLIQSLLFSLAIAVGMTPQLLPAVVSISLATGSKQLARRKVLVKRLVCIEDLGDMDILVTDKTGTLTEGSITFERTIDPAGQVDEQPRRLGLLAADLDITDGQAVGGNPLDIALWQASVADLPSGYVRLGELPFDHERRMSTAVVRPREGAALLITKGAPEAVMAACAGIPSAAPATLDDLFSAGSRVIAVATKPAGNVTTPTAKDEQALTLVGFLVFLDPPKAGAKEALQRLANLGIEVKIATGDNPRVAQHVCAALGLSAKHVLTGPDLDQLDDDALATAAEQANVFARISPEHKARIVRALRHRGRAVGFLGDGVNDALALHEADIGISVESATDVAKDAADVVLLEKSLDVLADGVAEGRRIFANTIKYVLMGTSSNFGNMFSAAAASALLKFLPMLPSQILLNNLLYDASQLTLPTDHVDEEQLAAPSHWDIGFIRRFMLFFGPVSSVFDFMTFGIMLGPLHAGPTLFRSGWFVESLATQTLVIFAIRTRRVPFFRSRPSWPLVTATLVIVAIAVALPVSPLAHVLGFSGPPIGFYVALLGMVIAYIVLIEFAKRLFFAEPHHHPGGRTRGRTHLIHRRAARFSTS